MKKILFSIVMLALGTAAFSQSSGTTTTQNCFNVLPSTRILPQPGLPGNYQLIIDYNNDGNKSLGVVIKCGNTQINPLNTCLEKQGAGTFTYSNLPCASGNITAELTPYVGSCGVNPCNVIIIYGGIAAAPTPVKLSGFSAVRSKQVVALNWNTEFEIDSKEFLVERAEGTEFRSVGTIKSNGNSSTKKSYSFNDKNENVGTTYYRLKNVDLNGKFNYSEIRTVKGIGSASDVTVFPNPAASNSKISVNGVAPNSTIQLLDFSGKVIKNIISNTVNLLDLNGVKNGTYLIRITDKSTNEVVNKKLTVSN